MKNKKNMKKLYLSIGKSINSWVKKMFSISTMI